MRVIAATALRYDLALVTHNPADYQAIPGLTIISPWSEGRQALEGELRRAMSCRTVSPSHPGADGPRSDETRSCDHERAGSEFPGVHAVPPAQVRGYSDVQNS